MCVFFLWINRLVGSACSACVKVSDDCVVVGSAERKCRDSCHLLTEKKGNNDTGSLDVGLPLIVFVCTMQWSICSFTRFDFGCDRRKFQLETDVKGRFCWCCKGAHFRRAAH